MTLEEAEAEMRPTAASAPGRLLPKSVQQQMRESAAAHAADKQLQQEVVVSHALWVKDSGSTARG
jgi:hypothetical protein